MSRVSFEVAGIRDIENGLENISRQQRQLEDAALTKAAEPVLSAIQARAPVRTGRGRDAIKIGKVRTLQGARYVSVGVHKEDHGNGLHMYYQEFGTSRHRAQPSIRPGYEETKSTAFAIVRAVLKEGLSP